MKIRAEVIDVQTNQETITIVLRGQSKRHASWRRLFCYEIQVPHSEPNCKTYYLGRIVHLEVQT